MLFLHDGTPAGTEKGVTNFFNDQYSNRWIAHDGPVAWPLQSPDLNPLDFFMWETCEDTYSVGKPIIMQSNNPVKD